MPKGSSFRSLPMALGLTFVLAATATAATHEVTVTGEGTANPTFSPASLTIQPGDTVSWTWTGFHNVQSGNGITPCSTTAPDFCSGSAQVGGTFAHTFTTSGTYPYVCTIHLALGMTGVVNVSAAAVPSLTPVGLGATLVILGGLGIAWRQRHSPSAG